LPLSTEAELLGAYARGTISGKQRRQIERWLLASTTQQRKLAFAEALATKLPRAQHPTNWPRLAAIAAGLILLAAVSVLTLQNRRLENELLGKKPL
jgi:hypothetical protein